ncbi:MAG: SRPBCC family protein [Gemmatimonadaceae bacterium]
MKWMIIAVAVLVAVVVAVAAIGAILPRDHIASRTATIAAPPDSVWAALTHPEAYPAWRKDVDRVVLAPLNPAAPGTIAWREYSKSGSDESLGYVIEHAEAPHHLVTRITDANLPYSGAWTIAIEPAGAGSRVTITERGLVSNPIFRFVSRYVIGLSSSLDAYLHALGKKAGADVVPTDAAPLAIR